MMTYIFGSWLVLATVGESATIRDIAQEGANLGTLAPAAIWAFVALVSVVGLIYIYKEKEKDDEALKTIIKDTTIAINNNTNTLDRLNRSIESCPKKGS